MSLMLDSPVNVLKICLTSRESRDEDRFFDSKALLIKSRVSLSKANSFLCTRDEGSVAWATDSTSNNSGKRSPRTSLDSSKENVLSNAATYIKIILDGHMNLYNDLRAFYAISDTPNFDAKFVPFPGYTNLNSNNEVRDKERSDGRPDKLVPYADPSGFLSSELDFKEFSWSIDNLPKFLSYRIKIILASTNQVYVPRIKDLRVITLA